ncbi:hypothetical protein [Paenibacillus sp. YYML68]|uniref:hypothetical protein n=1 Tax=Paenibacillus sp. YYML68 TaxID=2909250 RepID=UPI00248F553B|nr:hypothetical protein [Paenibacillus sp. YYML68]
MAVYWLVPIHWDGEALVLGADRLRLAPEEARLQLSRALQAVHPRLLLTFKAHLLLSDETLDACGLDELPFELSAEGDIRLHSADHDAAAAGALEATEGSGDRQGWTLSHCGEAYIHGLLGAREAALKLEQAEQPDDAIEAVAWINVMKAWLAEGRQIIMLKEERA